MQAKLDSAFWEIEEIICILGQVSYKIVRVLHISKQERTQ
jgi:hypothetical protein